MNDQAGQPLDYQQIRPNRTITLRKKVLDAVGADAGDWLVVLSGGDPGTIILKRQADRTYDYGSDGRG